MTNERKLDSGDDSIKKRTRQQSLKYMINVVEKKNKLSQSDNSTNVSYRKKKIFKKQINHELMIFEIIRRRFLNSLSF